MSFDRTPWRAKFVINKPTPWTCARCGRGALIAAEKAISLVLTADSIAAHQDAAESWEPYWDTHRFAGFLSCNNGQCGEHTAVCGLTTTEEEWIDEVGEHGFATKLVPLFFDPPPQIIKIPQKSSKDVQSALETSFFLYWSDPSASGNRIRSAIEFLLDGEKIPRRKKVGRDLSLHARLLKYKARRPDIADQLIAIKWLGNAGTHTRTLTHDDVLDAYELLEACFEEIFDERSKRLKKLAAKITKRKGPAK